MSASQRIKSLPCSLIYYLATVILVLLWTGITCSGISGKMKESTQPQTMSGGNCSKIPMRLVFYSVAIIHSE
jgi:hypothetical protein